MDRSYASLQAMFALAVVLSSPALAQPDAASLPFLNDEAKARIEKEYVSAKPHKALAMTEAGAWRYANARGLY